MKFLLDVPIPCTQDKHLHHHNPRGGMARSGSWNGGTLEPKGLGHPDQTIHEDVSAWQIFYQDVRRILMTKRFPSTKTNITAILHSSQITSSA